MSCKFDFDFHTVCVVKKTIMSDKPCGLTEGQLDSVQINRLHNTTELWTASVGFYYSAARMLMKLLASHLAFVPIMLWIHLDRCRSWRFIFPHSFTCGSQWICILSEMLGATYSAEWDFVSYSRASLVRSLEVIPKSSSCQATVRKHPRLRWGST